MRTENWKVWTWWWGWWWKL